MTTAAMADIKTIFRFLSTRTRRRLLLVLLLMPLTALAEMLMVGSIVPFLSLLGSGAEHGRTIPLLSRLIDGLEAISRGRPLAAAALLFALAAVTTATLRLWLNWAIRRFAFSMGHELSVEVQRRLLHQPYLFHVSSHSSRSLAAIDKVDLLMFDTAIQGTQAISASLITALVLAVLVKLDPLSAAAAAALVTSLYLVAMLAVRGRIGHYARLIAKSREGRLKVAQENAGAMRDIIIDRSQAAHLDAFRQIDRAFVDASSQTGLLTTAPRYLIEAAGLVLIALLALFVAGRPGGLDAALPVLGALALGAQRLLPLASQLFNGWASIASARPTLRELTSLLRLPVEEDRDSEPPLPFDHSIELDQASFHYPGRTLPALHDISLLIPHGARVAVVGKSGSGKSTLADLLMGLIEADRGQMRVDGEPVSGRNLIRWRQSIAHVPQSIFLADASIARNIALGDPHAPLDMQRLAQAAEVAQLTGFIASLPDGFETQVGERGVRLSGGQRQRLALARAIYKRAPVLLLDEATSALDDATEAAVLAAIDKLHAEGCTVIVIAHRMSTVRHSDLVFMLDEGRLVRAGPFEELYGSLDRLRQQGEL